MLDKLPKDFLEIALKEYEKLKDEQIQRIGFRDNVMYVTLVVVGGVVSFALGSSGTHVAVLLIPWICLILGWTYLVNDQKISAIGRYIRMKLDDRIRRQAGISERVLFGWEVEHRSDENRLQRKVLQCVVDLIAFCFSGIAAVGIFLLVDKPTAFTSGVGILEIALLVGLGIEFVVYADFGQGRV